MLFGVGLPVKAVSSASSQSQECGIYYATKHDVFAHHPYLFRRRARALFRVVTISANGDRRRAASVLKY